MASDYELIRKDHQDRYGWDIKSRRIYKRLYSDKTHFVDELIQNADDSDSLELVLHLDSDALTVWNNGRLFDEKDVRGICSLGLSDKDLTHIGTFGIGFKSVYNYTDCPEIYSDDERFRIRDFVKPEGIQETPPEVEQLIKAGNTVFRLPFKNSLKSGDVDGLKNRLCNLSKERTLLFLRHLEKVEWLDKRNGQKGVYSCHRRPYDNIQDVPKNVSVERVELTASLNGGDPSSEKFLVFSKKARPPKAVIDWALEQAEDNDDRQRVQRSKKEPQTIEVAFKLEEGKIAAMDDDSALFAYLPTQMVTRLRFLIQARYQTTPPRDNIAKPKDSRWNEWLIQETADLLPETLEMLKTGGLLEPAFFNALPLQKGDNEGDNVPEEFERIVWVLEKAMKERELVPTHRKEYMKAENVFYPDSQGLWELLNDAGWLPPECGWLHPDIQDNKAYRRSFETMQAAGVKTVGIDNALSWLKEQDAEWFEKRQDDWIRRLYAYLEKNESKIERVKTLPLIRLKNGKHVCADKKLAFFLPDAEEEREGLKPFLNELPILQASLLDGDQHGRVKLFLKNLGVRELKPENVIREWILPLYPQYSQEKPSIERNRLHIRYLREFWDKLSGYEHGQLRTKVSDTPILRAYKGVQPEAFDFVKPYSVYLPEAYTGAADLETYFAAANDDVWFVDSSYMKGDSERKSWLSFLKKMGATDAPRVIIKRIYTSVGRTDFDKELAKRSLKWAETNRPDEVFIADRDIRALQTILSHIKANKDINLAHALWSLLINASSRSNNYFQGTYHWRPPHHRSLVFTGFEADFYSQLKETPWLPDKQDNFRCPSELFAPTSENSDVLGDSVAYLHPDFDVSTGNEDARRLAEKLGAHLNAHTDSVLKYLESLSKKDAAESSVEKVEPIYRFLAEAVQDEPQIYEFFKENRLIFTSDPEPRWWTSDQAFWEDQSVVFGNRRGYLKNNYARYEQTLKPFFLALEVSDRAEFSDYARVIREIASKERAEDDEVRGRVETLYRHIMPNLHKGSESMEDEWEQMRSGKCWLGKKGDTWDFFSSQELVWEDDKHRSELFAGKVPFWAFNDDLLVLAKRLEIKGCRQASVAKFDKVGPRPEVETWSEEARLLYPYIYDFLNSPWRRQRYDEEKSAEFLKRLSVFRAEKITAKYELNGLNKVSVDDPNPRQSFLDKENKRLWLGGANERAYLDLIGDALQDYFGVSGLREFVKDLLTSGGDAVLPRWEQRGFVPKRCLSSPAPTPDPDTVPEPDPTPIPVPTPELDPTPIPVPTPELDPTPIPIPIPSNGGKRNGGGTGHGSGRWHQHQHVGGSGSGGGGGGEGDDHWNLKIYLANNPALLGPGLVRAGIEYEFGSGDHVDILLKDRFGNPVTVEVKAYRIPSTNRDEMWQAVKYKHLAAVQFGRVCKDVRSILAAPSIPDGVKRECKRRGVEPFEIPESIMKEALG
ncbi:MAG: endonuclease NucS [Candidatus Poribacteria bacterium]|nr:endonuclease NucS [Candidatus Poribacteria bacterium]